MAFFVTCNRKVKCGINQRDYSPHQMIMPYFQVENHIGTVVTTEDVTPTVSIWRVTQAANRPLMTDCTDQTVCE
jgi:hypothetical protein